MADQDFMSKLDTATDGKAVEIMETLNNDLDARKLEDTSTDTVKASEGKEIKVKVSDLDIDFDKASQKKFVEKVKQALELNPDITLEEAIEAEAARIGGQRGFAYENVIISKLKNLKIPGFKVSTQAGGNKVGIPDFASTIFGANFNVEVKLEKARYSDVGLISRNQKIVFNNNVLKKNYSFLSTLQKNLLDKAKKPMKEYRKKAGELGADLDLYDRTGLIPATIYQQLKELGFQKKVTQSINTNQAIISELYANKVPPTFYIQLKDSGMFYMGQNPLGLPMPELTGNVDVVLSVSKGSKSMQNGIEMRAVNLRIKPSNLTNVGKSDYSLDNVSDIKKLMKSPEVEMLKLNEEANTKINNPMLPLSLNFKESKGGDIVVKTMQNADAALNNARKLDAPVKKIRVFDFDDTLAKTNSKIIVTGIDGKITKINATQFAVNSQQLEAEGASFDFSEFSKVIDGKKGPLFDLAKKIADSPGKRDMFILTARPQNAANGIKTFLEGIGLNIPLENITGLQDGSPQAKARWMVEKAAEGYNDFYFADDALKNVKAVKDILSTVDVKSKVQQAKASKGKTFSTVMNNILEDSTGIKSEAEFSKARAQTVGASKSKFTFFTTPSAEDFLGLVYKFIGKGKVGDAQLKFFKDNVFDPYNRAEQAVTRAKITAANDFKKL